MLAKAIQLSLRLALAGLVLEMTGGQFMLLQTVAWTQMIVAYSRNAPLKEALKETFDGRHPCEMCKGIQKARQTEKKPDVGQVNLKLKREIFCQPHAAIVCSPPQPFRFQIVSDVNRGAWSERPPVPPPKFSGMA